MNLVRRVLFVAWQNQVTRRIYPVARLLDLDRADAPRWEFAYLRGAHAAAGSGFVPFHGFGGLTEVSLSAELPPFFTNRIMRKSRPDFAAYMQSLGLPTQAHEEVPLLTLARSEGRRASDTIELYGLPTFDEARRAYRFLFFARGVRHVEGADERIGRLSIGAELDLRPDPTNPVDQLALRVHEGGGGMVGYVPNTLLEDLHELERRHSRVTACVERINLDPAPVQLRLLCRIEAAASGGYLPFTSERYQPIAPDATRLNIEPSLLTN